MKTSSNGIALIKQLEGFSSTAYWDVDGYSIGYGHHGARAGQTVTRDQAEQLLAADLAVFEQAVNQANPSLSQNQFDAAVSLCYNIGTTRFRKSTVAALIAADPSPRPELEQQWKQWRLAGGQVSQALVSRRNKEWELYKRINAAPLLLGVAVVTTLAVTSLMLINF